MEKRHVLFPITVNFSGYDKPKRMEFFFYGIKFEKRTRVIFGNILLNVSHKSF